MRSIEFVSYDGEWPNLCRGELKIKNNGVVIEFQSGFLNSGGSAEFNSDYSESYIFKGAWYLSSNYKEYLKDKSIKFIENELEELEKIVNDNVKLGCCGGCLKIDLNNFKT